MVRESGFLIGMVKQIRQKCWPRNMYYFATSQWPFVVLVLSRQHMNIIFFRHTKYCTMNILWTLGRVYSGQQDCLNKLLTFFDDLNKWKPTRITAIKTAQNKNNRLHIDTNLHWIKDKKMKWLSKKHCIIYI